MHIYAVKFTRVYIVCTSFRVPKPKFGAPALGLGLDFVQLERKVLHSKEIYPCYPSFNSYSVIMYFHTYSELRRYFYFQTKKRTKPWRRSRSLDSSNRDLIQNQIHTEAPSVKYHQTETSSWTVFQKRHSISCVCL